jgi:transcriptional regulator with XRE-family HTH domain
MLLWPNGGGKMESSEPKFRHIGLSSDGAVVFCDLDNGNAYALPLCALEKAENWAPQAKPIGVSIIHDGYAAVVEFEGDIRIDFPSDFVLHVCEPSYAYYKNDACAATGIGKRIREIRKSRGLTLDRLADKCGIAKPTLSRLENDRVTPTSATIKCLASALRTHPALLVANIKPNDAWTRTNYEFIQWNLGLRWQNGVGDHPISVRALVMVKVFLARFPEHEYARSKLVRAAARYALGEYMLDARKWAEVAEGAKAVHVAKCR